MDKSSLPGKSFGAKTERTYKSSDYIQTTLRRQLTLDLLQVSLLSAQDKHRAEGGRKVAPLTTCTEKRERLVASPNSHQTNICHPTCPSTRFVLILVWKGLMTIKEHHNKNWHTYASYQIVSIIGQNSTLLINKRLMQGVLVSGRKGGIKNKLISNEPALRLPQIRFPNPRRVVNRTETCSMALLLKHSSVLKFQLPV